MREYLVACCPHVADNLEYNSSNIYLCEECSAKKITQGSKIDYEDMQEMEVLELI